jgi:hypothetical protein
MSDTLPALEQQRESLLQEISQLPDLRPGSITGTGGRCGSPTCHCHRPSLNGLLRHRRPVKTGQQDAIQPHMPIRVSAPRRP